MSEEEARALVAQLTIDEKMQLLEFLRSIEICRDDQHHTAPLDDVSAKTDNQ